LKGLTMPSLWATAPENLLIPKGQPMHTPAPWKIEDGESRRVYLINDSKGHAVGEIFYSDTRTRSDAELIAAAPDLLQLVEELLTQHIAHHNNPIHTKARKLLNQLKAAQ
jgi:hypothetical protein